MLKEEHTLFIVKLVDGFAPMTLQLMREKLLEKYVDISISKTQFYRHVKEQCVLSFKKLEKRTEYRNSDKTFLKRKIAVESWLADSYMDFEKNCIFIDEAGFNLHISRMRGWSKVGKPARTKIPKNKGTTITILGAISSQGVIDISLRNQFL